MQEDTVVSLCYVKSKNMEGLQTCFSRVPQFQEETDRPLWLFAAASSEGHIEFLRFILQRGDYTKYHDTEKWRRLLEKADSWAKFKLLVELGPSRRPEVDGGGMNWLHRQALSGNADRATL